MQKTSWNLSLKLSTVKESYSHPQTISSFEHDSQHMLMALSLYSLKLPHRLQCLFKEHPQGACYQTASDFAARTSACDVVWLSDTAIKIF